VDAAIHEIRSVISLPSGYHRDLQFTKPPLIRGLSAAMQALKLVPDLIGEMTFDAERMRKAISRDMYATDMAVELAAGGTPFRSAYRQVKESLGTADDRSPEASLRQRVSPGASADLRLEEIRKRLEAQVT
jgi:argininosuccinate lyase